MSDNVFELNTFEEFELKLSEVKSKYGARKLLYRGQASHEWGLETTFERWLPGNPGFFDTHTLYQLALEAMPQIEAFTTHRWERTWSYEQVEEFCEDSESFIKPLPYYEYLTYLRHHGFPSPLLDWTASEYVAAFFAFHEAEKVWADEAGKVAIYAFCDMPDGFHMRDYRGALIRKLGPIIRSHQRHFLQGSQYTVCMRFFDGRGWSFAPHDQVFDDPQKGENQDILLKFVLPASERRKALNKLDLFNLNKFSLFQTEEAMLEVLAHRVKERLLNS